MLYPGDGRILTRLRLSGVELNGTALVDGAQLRLIFPNRPDATGELLSTSEMNLWLEPNGQAFRLTKTETAQESSAWTIHKSYFPP
jgi:hypothetical protein